MTNPDVTGTGGLAHDARRRAGSVLLWLRPDGWQARARRNAWAAMVADRQRRQVKAYQREPLVVSAGHAQLQAH